MYRWTEPVKNFYPKNHVIKGRTTDGIFVATKDHPTYILSFPNDVEILKIKFRTATDIEKVADIDEVSDLSKIVTKGIESLINLPFQLLGNALEVDSLKFDQPIAVAISYDAGKNWEQYDLDEKTFSKDENAYLFENQLSETKATKDVVFQVLALRSVREGRVAEIIYHPDELTYFIKDLQAEREAVKYNLQYNKDKSANENLIRYLAVNEPNLFRELQLKKSNYILDDFSILKLPNDIDISYGMNNFSKILRTGEYQNQNKVFKKFDVNKVYSTKNLSYENVARQINNDGNEKQLNLKNKTDQNSNFIDFDKGI